MNIRHSSKCFCLLTTICIALFVSTPAFAQKGKKKPPTNDPPVSLPSIRYSISEVPIPGTVTAWGIGGMNNFTTAVGYYRDAGGEERAYLFNAITGDFYDFDTEQFLTDQVDAVIPGF
jgi:hypothetical protein